MLQYRRYGSYFLESQQKSDRQLRMSSNDSFLISYKDSTDVINLELQLIVSIVKPTRCIYVSNLFYWSTCFGGLSVHHQELKTLHTATGICQTDTVVCLLVGTRWNCSSISYPLASRQRYLFDICQLQYVQYNS